MESLFRNNFDRVPVGVAKYGVGEWDHLVHGNHRAVVDVKEQAPAICAYLPWRRRDRHPENKHISVVSAATGQVVENSVAVSCNREYGEVVFEATAAGQYYLYYFIPGEDKTAHSWPRWAFPITRYLPPHSTASKEWLSANNLLPTDIFPLPQTGLVYEGEIPAEGDLGLQQTKGVVYEAAWRKLPQAELVEFQARSEFDSFYPMEIAATQDERISMEHRGRYRPLMLFPESRRFPIRMTDMLPQHWAVSKLEQLSGVSDTVCRNEYFVFQIGVYAHKGTLPHLKVEWTGLQGSSGRIPQSAITCFNTEGIDQFGKPFTKVIHVETRKVQALWFGIDIPESASPGQYEGAVTISADEMQAQTVRLSLTVAPEALADRGDGDHWRLSRLRWLNSTLGLDEEVCPPYTKVVVDKLKNKVLGREIELGGNGLPARMASFIEMFEIIDKGRDILAAPANVSAFLPDGTEAFLLGGCQLVSQTPRRTVFHSNAAGNSLSAAHETTVEAEGVVVSRIRLKAEKATELESMRLDLRLPADVAKLIMWPDENTNGDPCPEAYEVESYKLERLWVGDYNAGLALRLPPGDNGWDNQHQGRLRLSRSGQECAITLDSGRVRIAAGETVEFALEFYVTPFKPLAKAHWDWRYYHAQYMTLLNIPQGVAAGAKIFIQHHETASNPYINYPLLTSDILKRMSEEVHAQNGLFKFYYTVRELSVRAPELWALRSLGDEILTPAIGHFGHAEMDDLPAEYQMRSPYGHPNNGMPWLCEHLVSDYHTRWHSNNKSAELADGSLQISGASRWGNFFIESLHWLMANAGLDGLYFDGLTFDRDTLRRVRKTLMSAKPYALIDNHGGPSCIDRAPFYDSTWFGEGADYARNPEYWLATVSGIPFGLPGEMLLPHASVARGMVYGIAQRYGWMDLKQVDPSALWRWWDSFGIAKARMLGYWDKACPVKVDHPQVKATAYVHLGHRLAIALASWAPEKVTIKLAVDWPSVGLDPKKAAASMPEIAFFQAGQSNISLDAVAVEPDKGWIIEVG